MSYRILNINKDVIPEHNKVLIGSARKEMPKTKLIEQVQKLLLKKHNKAFEFYDSSATIITYYTNNKYIVGEYISEATYDNKEFYDLGFYNLKVITFEESNLKQNKGNIVSLLAKEVYVRSDTKTKL